MLKDFLFGSRRKTMRSVGIGFAAGFAGGLAYWNWDFVAAGLERILGWILAGGNFLLLVVGYSLTWFLGCALVFILWGRKGGSMTLPMAAVMGILSAILHLIVCHFIGNPCKF